MVPPRAPRERTLKLLSALIGIVAGLLTGEGTLRAWAALTGRDPARELQRTAEEYPPRPGAFDDCHAPRQASLGQLVRPSPDAEIVYELKPGLETCFYHALVRTNSQGLRAPRDFARPKPAGVFRILLLGDSQTFGWGVRYEDTFGAVLERRLNARPHGRRVEVVNTAVPGYNAAQEAEVLLRRGLAFEPDCVLVLFIGNDFGVPFLMLAPPRPLDWQRSFLLATLRAVLRPRRVVRNPWIVADEELLDRFTDSSLERVPPAYRHMVGLAGYERALASMAATARRAGIPIVDFADYDGLVQPEVADALKRLHARLGLIRPEFHYPLKTRLWLSEKDPHFNPEGHRSLARRMLRALRRERACLASHKPAP